jgi:hypothetical protein
MHLLGQETPSAQPGTAGGVGGLLIDPSWWTILWVGCLSGALGGVAYELIALQGTFELPHRPDEAEFANAEPLPHAIAKHVYDLGGFARIIIGGLAAIVALMVLNPTSLVRLIATSVAAGSAGVAVFRSIQDRLLAAIAESNMNRARGDAQEALQQHEQVVDQVETLVQKIRGEPGAEGVRAFAKGGREEIGAVEKDLNTLLVQLGRVGGALKTATRGGARN